MYALALLGRDYRFGGTNPERGLDCSGMVGYIYAQAIGMSLPHNAARMAQMGQFVPDDRLQPGDLVFFNTTGKPASHVGVYIGRNQFIHAPSANGKIRISELSNRYFSRRYEQARRYVR